MTPRSASATALGVAKRRAAHQLLDHPVVFLDPLAEKILLGIDGLSLPTSAAAPDARGSRFLRAFVAARSRYTEDELSTFFARGCRQYVVLGAGLDTFAYRNPYTPALKVFEVDHPDTQAWKIERLHTAGILIPGSLTFVPVNFETEDLAQVLHASPAFNSALPAFFSLLGVTPYLTRDALLKTLAIIAAMPAGSGVVFDYAVPAASLPLFDRIALSLLSARVARLGEAFHLFLAPQELSGILRELGFVCVQDLGQQEINSRYFQNRQDGLRIGGAIGRLARAIVGPDHYS